MDFEGIENSPMVQKGQLCILHIHIVQVNGGQMRITTEYSDAFIPKEQIFPD